MVHAKQHNIYAHTHTLTVSSVCLLLFSFVDSDWYLEGVLLGFWWALHSSTNINMSLMACCAFLFPIHTRVCLVLSPPLSIVQQIPSIRLRCKGKTGPAVFISVCECELFLFVLLSKFDIISCVFLLISSLYLEWRTSWASFTNSTQRTSAWNPVSFSFFLVFLFSFLLDCTIVISVGIFFFLSTRVQKLSKLIWVFLFVCFCIVCLT